ncbi:hypothetical protein JGU66_28525, partial [Myxococcaceae bacterium JPH2]|nr:hypothetical protein [Myxococcaceae bacterium JPH2]
MDRTPHRFDIPTGSWQVDFKPFASVSANDAGDFTLEVLKGESERFSENQNAGYRFRVALPLDAAGQGAFLSFSFDDDVELPPL